MNADILDPMLPQLYRVQRVRREIPDTFTLELEPANGSGIPPFATGQFNMLYVFGVGEVPISISGNPAQPTPLVHTTRAVGTVTKAMRELKPDDVIGVRGPFGSHWPIELAQGKDVVIVAGGIGLAPLRSAMYHIIAQREKYGKVALLYGARTTADILYRRELEHWQTGMPVPRTGVRKGHPYNDLEVYVTVDHASSAWRAWRSVRTHLHLDGAQHEMCRRLLWALPVRATLRLQGWSRLPVQPRAQPVHKEGDMIWPASTGRNWPSGNLPPAMAVN